jgi:DNA processing protein
VLAVPGPVTSAMSAGCHRLIRREENPARLVTSLAEVLEYCGSLDGGLLTAMESDTGAGPESPGVTGHRSAPAAIRQQQIDSLDVVARAVLDGFPSRRSVTEAELATLSGQPIHAVIGSLPVLQSLGLITAARQGYRISPSGVAS